MPASPSSHFATIQNATVAQLLLKYLQLEGATTLFGIPGGALKNLLDELKNQRAVFDYIVCRHETGAAYIADGYARVTGKLGVVIVTSGPGATNALTGTMNAHSSGSPLLTITGEVPEKFFGMGYLQEGIDADLNIAAIYRNATRYSEIVTNEANFQTLFTQALRDALSVPSRAAHISLPDDVAGTPLSSTAAFPTSPANYRATPDGASSQKIEQAFTDLMQAQRPLIFLGNGCRRALQGDRLQAFTAFVEKFALPVMTTPDAKAIFPETHALSLRTYGMASCQWPSYYLDATLPTPYDALLVLGSALGELATMGQSMPWSSMLMPRGTVTQVDLNQAAIARAFPVTLGVVAEVGAFMDGLCALGADTEPNAPVVAARGQFIASIKAAHSPFRDPDERDSNAVPIMPQALMRCINDQLPDGVHVFIDSANCVGWSLHYLVLDPPTQIHYSLDMGPLGCAVAGVIGAKIGAPDKPCVAIVGDGAFLMHGNELSTAAQYGVGAVWVVLADNDLAMVSQGMNQFFPDPTVWKDYYSIGNANLARFATSLGAMAYEVSSPQEMREAFPQALANAETRRQPQVIITHINTDAVPPFYPPKVS